MHVDFQWTHLYIHDESESGAARHVETELSGKAHTKTSILTKKYIYSVTMKLGYNHYLKQKLVLGPQKGAIKTNSVALSPQTNNTD
jgi:hypothetical protein